jgi:type II secretory pathway component PulC
MKLRSLRPKIHFDKKGPDILAAMLHAVVFVMGGMLLAHWTWLLFAPVTQELPLALEQPTSSQLTTIVSGHWFASTSGQKIVATPATVNFKLMGIYASSGDKLGFAVFKLADGKQRAVLLHQEITAGIQLHAIKSDGVEVGSEGNVQTLTLENRKSNAAAPIPIGLQFNRK